MSTRMKRLFTAISQAVLPANSSTKNRKVSRLLYAFWKYLENVWFYNKQALLLVSTFCIFHFCMKNTNLILLASILRYWDIIPLRRRANEVLRCSIRYVHGDHKTTLPCVIERAPSFGQALSFRITVGGFFSLTNIYRQDQTAQFSQNYLVILQCGINRATRSNIRDHIWQAMNLSFRTLSRSSSSHPIVSSLLKEEEILLVNFSHGKNKT